MTAQQRKLSPASETISVTWMRVPNPNSPDITTLYRKLGTIERSRARQITHPSARSSYIAAHGLLLGELRRTFDTPHANFRFVKSANGKPELATRACHFNISHSRKIVACVIAPWPVGIDTEAADRPVNRDVIARLHPCEKARLHRLSPPHLSRDFFRLWTLKEAFMKSTGAGFSRPLDSFCVNLDPVSLTLPEGDRSIAPCINRFFECAPDPTTPMALSVLVPPDQVITARVSERTVQGWG